MVQRDIVRHNLQQSTHFVFKLSHIRAALLTKHRAREERPGSSGSRTATAAAKVREQNPHTFNIQLITVLMACQDVKVALSRWVISGPALQNHHPV